MLRFLRRRYLNTDARLHCLSEALQKLGCTKRRVATRRYGDLAGAMARDLGTLGAGIWGGVSNGST